jgi:gliding motility-associated protein GldM
MINIMYLVLTAMLALNVSAKIINAFFVINKGIKNSNTVLSTSAESLMKQLAKNVEQDKSKYGKIESTAKEVQRISKEFYDYVEGLREKMVTETGGYFPENDPHHAGYPKGYKNKDVTTRFLVNQGNGSKLEAKINSTREQILELVGRLKGTPSTGINTASIATDLEPAITLRVSDKDWSKEGGVKDWATYTFKQMPLAAVFPLLTKIQNDMKSSEAATLNYLSGQIGATTFKVDNFIPISSAKKSYVITGEPYEAEISVGAVSKSVSENMSITVDGSPLSVVDGVAKFTRTASATGVQSYNVIATLVNPSTGDRQSFTKKFEYEVGRRSVAVSADKMNVFYMGVQNPISVVAAGVSSNELRVSGSGVSLSGSGGKYMVTASAPGRATITVSAGSLRQAFEFRVKPIPDPVAKIGASTGGTMGNGELRANGGVLAVLENFDFEARCEIAGFNLTYVPKRQDPLEYVNPGPRFSGPAASAVAQAKPGDQYLFQNIRAKCPGDGGSTRKINSIAITIR